jgi:FKBP-type peptidyl-prolyl cis-trans isomerase FklB
MTDMRRRRPWAIGGLAVAAGLSAASPPRLPAGAAPPPTTQPAPVAPPAGGHRTVVLPPPLQPQPTPPPANASQPAATTAAMPTVPVHPPPPPATAPVPPPPATQPAPPAPAALTGTPPVPIPDAVAYWAGLQAGRELRERLADDGSGFDEGSVIKGLIDGLSNREPAVDRFTAQALLDQLEANVLQRRAEKRAADDPAFRRLADDNGGASAAVLAENAKRVGVRVLPDGVQLEPLRAAGTGRPVAAARSVTVRLSVSLADGTLVAAEGPPTKLVLGDALPALVDALRPMRVGDKWRILLPPDKAYGLAGRPPLIGPNQAVAYDVELMEAQ